MLRYMLDTNLCIEVLRRPESPAADRFKAHEASLCISTITLHELHRGADTSRRPAYQRALTESFIARLTVLEFDVDAASHSGNIHATLSQTGKIIGAYDMLIAGHARSRGMTVVTNNLGEFSRVAGLRCEDWL
jgi:tRNA(fMet)-specific endonuclease VapC